MIIFILGGVKGGKSMLAQCAARYLSKETPEGNLYYLATMMPGDEEDEKRIKRHIQDRDNWGFATIEEGSYLNRMLEQVTKNDVVLLDSVTAYVQNILFGDINAVCHIGSEEIYSHIRSLGNRVKDLIIVSDYIFSDALQYNADTEMFKRVLGEVHALIASESDVVVECAYSNMKFWKNKDNYHFANILNEYYGCRSHLEYKDI